MNDEHIIRNAVNHLAANGQEVVDGGDDGFAVTIDEAGEVHIVALAVTDDEDMFKDESPIMTRAAYEHRAVEYLVEHVDELKSAALHFDEMRFLTLSNDAAFLRYWAEVQWR